MSDAPRTVLVTGDVIVDHHIYMGERASHDSQRALGSRQDRVLGGARLVFDLLERVASGSSAAKKRDIREIKQAGSSVFKRLTELLGDGSEASAGAKAPLAEQIKAAGGALEEIAQEVEKQADPGPAFQVEFGLDVTTESEFPSHLNGYAIWKPVPIEPKSKDFVWRIEKPLGYGRIDDRAAWFTQRSHGAKSEGVARTSPERDPQIVVIDDAGLGIRFAAASWAWPAALDRGDSLDWIVLKMARPLAQGDLWDKLRAHREKLVVVVSVDDIRRAPVRVTRGISWERTALDLADELTSNDEIRMLRDCRHLVINLRSEGALHVDLEPGKTPVFRLIFDPEHLEGEWEAKRAGSVFGFTSCIIAGLVHQLARGQAAPDLASGIKAGLSAIRTLVQEGHGASEKEPRAQLDRVADAILSPTVAYQLAQIPTPSGDRVMRESAWTIIADAEERLRGAKIPLYGLAKGVALTGMKGLSHVPHGRFGKFLTVDRSEIEALRSIHLLIREYVERDEGKKPLSLAVFGPPGAGKSFAVKQISEMIGGDENDPKSGPKTKALEFNVSQFSDPSDLIGAFHQVRDCVLEGAIPFVFWDEFDCSEYRWLQYLLAPMQDGAFQEGQVTHPIGKAVFIFAGGTSHTMEAFGPRDPHDPGNAGARDLTPESLREQTKKWDHFRLSKGPDFKSRIVGFLNVLGPNPRLTYDDAGHPVGSDPRDIYFPVRRALFLRSVMGLLKDAKQGERLDIDRGVLAALLEISSYTHGSRSLEKLILQIRERSGGGLGRSGLPPPDLLRLFVTDAKGKPGTAEFLGIMERNRDHPFDAEAVARDIHDRWLDRAKAKGESIRDHLNRKYDELDLDWKRDNLAAALRMPGVLELAGLYIEKDEDKRGSDAIVGRVIEHYLDLLAEAEHDGWLDFRRRNGWTLGDRDDDLKRHSAMIPYRDLTQEYKDKDRESVRDYPGNLEKVGYRVVHSPTG